MALFIYPLSPVTVDASSLAQETTLQQVETNTSNTVTELQSANTELDSQTAILTSIDGKLSSPVAVTGPLTDAQLRAMSVPVSGPLTNAELRASDVPVTGPLTDTQLRASNVPVSVASLPLPSGAATETTLSSVKTAVEALETRVAGSLVPEAFDSQEISYVAAGNGIGEVYQVVYKLGITTIATLTLAYDSSNRVTSVIRS